MAARTSMAALISRVRLLINDTLLVGNGQVFDDDTIQGVLDEGRDDIVNKALKPVPTYSGSAIQYLDYYSEYGGWESDYVLKQYMTVVVTPSSVEPIVGVFTFSTSIFPGVYITGKQHDVYRASADLLVGGQQFKRSQAADLLLNLARSYRMKQRPKSILMTRSDIKSNGEDGELSLKATAIDYMASGNGNG